MKGFDLETSYVVLSDGPAAKRIDVGPDFWEKIDARDDLAGRLVGVFRYDGNWKSWEVHPDGDEIVILLEGAVDLVLDDPDGERIVELRNGGAAIVPRGIWHTANVRGRAAALHITRGDGTRHRAR